MQVKPTQCNSAVASSHSFVQELPLLLKLLGVNLYEKWGEINITK